MIFKAALITLIFSFFSCSHSTDQEDYGLHDTSRAYVPARISVLNCILWPKSLKFSNGPSINVNKQLSQKICQKIDKFVIDSFKDQPYMNGYTPKAVKKLLTKSRHPQHLDQIFSIWKSKEKDLTPPRLYRESISKNKEWIIWLNQFSEYTRYSDSILMPFLLTAEEKKVDNRGIQESQATLHYAFFLINTNTGKLIWSSHKKYTYIEQQNPFTPEAPKPNKDPWSELYRRVLIEHVWKDFPGRLTN